MQPEEFNDLLKKCRTDPLAMERLGLYCVSNIKRHLMYKFSNFQDIDDVAHESLIMVLSSPPGMYVKSPLAWIYKIADNFVLQEMRKRKRIFQLNENAAYELDLKKIIGNEELNAALDTLGEINKRIIVLRYFCGFRLYEVARMLNMTYVSVRARASRGIRSLQKLVTKSGLDLS